MNSPQPITYQQQLITALRDHYIATRRDKTLAVELSRWIDQTLISVAGQHSEGCILALIGRSGTGKTWAVEHAIRKLPDMKQALLCITAPRPCTLKQLGRAILTELGYELQRDIKEHITWEKVRFHLEANGIRFLWIDELQHVFDGKNDKEIAAISDTIKNLVQRRSWPVSFLLSGLPAVAQFLGRDRQLERRSRTLEFGPLTFPDSTDLLRNRILPSMVRDVAKLRLDDFVTDEFIHRLCHATGGAFGVVIDLTKSAILHSVSRPDSDDLVRLLDFAAAYAAERGCDSTENVFLARNWHEIRPENSRLRHHSTAVEV